MREQKAIGTAIIAEEHDDFANGYYARARSRIPKLQPPSPEPAILRELDLGRYTLFMMDDGGIDLLTNDQRIPYLADNMISLDSDETYHLFISLQEQFKQKEVIQQANPFMD